MGGQKKDDPEKPFGFQWHLTNRCNLRCSHCYQDQFSSRSQLPLEAHKEIALKIFRALGDRPVSINLTGGEPFVLPWLEQLISYLGSFENLRELTVISNGTCSVEQLRTVIGSGSKSERSRKIDRLKISIESADPVTNNSIRGRGSFELVDRNIGLYKQLNLNLVLMVTLGSYNVETIEETIHWARSRRINGIIFERFIPYGRGLKIKESVLNTEQWARATSTIARCAGLEPDLEGLMPYRAYWLDLETMELAGALCNLGDESMALMPDGTVYPCRRLPIAVANIRAQPFDEILRKLREFAPDQLKKRLVPGPCRSCSMGECSGCRALAFAQTGDLLGDDHQCFSMKI